MFPCIYRSATRLYRARAACRGCREAGKRAHGRNARHASQAWRSNCGDYWHAFHADEADRSEVAFRTIRRPAIRAKTQHRYETAAAAVRSARSEEHTSELQSP